MESGAATDIVRRLWECFAARRWAAAGDLLADDVVVEWPHSGELIRGRDNVLAVNAEYPGEWQIRVLGVFGAGDRVASHVEVRNGPDVEWAASFFRVTGGQIRHVREYWLAAPTEPPPAWRSRYVERL